jgi:hypothetical protein
MSTFVTLILPDRTRVEIFATLSGDVPKSEFPLVKPCKVLALGLLAAVPLTLAGCSSSHSGTPGATPTGVSASGAAAADTQLTGTQLQNDMLTAAQLPANVKVEPNSKYDSGSALETGAAKYRLSGIDCNQLIADMSTEGFGESAMAFQGAGDAHTGVGILVEIRQFSDSTGAYTFYATLRAKWSACGTFTGTTSVGISPTLTVSTFTVPSGLGESDFGIRMDSRSSIGAQVELNTVVLQGVDVYLMATEAPGADAVYGIDDAPMIKQLMANVAANR